MLLLIGWRGEPGKRDEPQHRIQGPATPGILGQNVQDEANFSPHPFVFSRTGNSVSTVTRLSRLRCTSVGNGETLHGNGERTVRSARQTANVSSVFVAEKFEIERRNVRRTNERFRRISFRRVFLQDAIFPRGRVDLRGEVLPFA